MPDEVEDPGRQRSFDPLATSANWWDLPPLAPEEYEPPVAPVPDAPQAAEFSAPVGIRLGAPAPRVGFAEGLVASTPRRTSEHNELGQFSLLIGIGLFFFLGVSYVAGFGVRFGLRGLSAERRGLATNRGSSIAGLVLAAFFVVTFFVTYVLYTVSTLRDAVH
jgi:hypothetical protein